MHNWRFLLLAFFAVFQPIASFEPGLVDGRQRCDYRTASLLRDPGVHFHGTYRFTKPLEDRRLNHRQFVREVRRNEVREESVRTYLSPEKRLVDNFESRGTSPTRLIRSSRTDYRLARDAIDLRRETRGTQLRTEYRNERNYEVEQERWSSLPGNRQTRLDSRHHLNKLAEDENKSRSRRASASRVQLESRQYAQSNRDPTELPRVLTIREIRIVSNRARDENTSNGKELRIAREMVQMDTQRSESRAQRARNADQRNPERRSRNIQLRSSSVLNARPSNNEDLPLAVRDQRRSIQSRRTLDGQNLQRESRITHRYTVSAEHRVISKSSDRTRNVQTLQSYKNSEHRLDSCQRDARLHGRDCFEENRNGENIRDSRVTRASLLEERLAFQDPHRDSRIPERERTAENRREARDTRSMKSNARSVERAAENRRYSRLADHKRGTENQRDIRIIARESRTVMQNRAVEYKREVRSIARDSRQITDESYKNNRYSCSLHHEGSTERQLANGDVEKPTRILAADRDTLNQNTRNVEKASRTLGFKRAADNSIVDRKSMVLVRDRITQRQKNTRMNFREASSVDRVQSRESHRNNQNAVIQTVRVELNRKYTRSFGRISVSANRRDTRVMEIDARSLERRQSSEARYRQNQNTQRDTRPFAREISLDSREDIRNAERQSRTTEVKRIILRERSAENRRNIRNSDERVLENGREIRNTQWDSRAPRSEEERVGSRITNMARSRDSHSTEGKNNRVAERLSIRDNRRSWSVSRASSPEPRHMSERSSMELERRESLNRLNTEVARKREFHGMKRHPAQAENETFKMNWQYLFYALQGVYICGVLIQLMNEKNAGKKTRAQSWWSAPRNLIKVD